MEPRFHRHFATDVGSSDNDEFTTPTSSKRPGGRDKAKSKRLMSNEREAIKIQILDAMNDARPAGTGVVGGGSR